MRTLFLSILIVLHLAPCSVAEPYVWKNVKVGGGGFIPGIVFSRVEKGLVYLRSDMGGCYRWDKAQQTWAPLQDHMSESSYFGIESIAPDPVDANVVYAAAGMYRGEPSVILRSDDRGSSWEVFPVSFRMGGNEDGRGVGERLAVDPNDNRILFYGSRFDGLMRSEDRGATWKKVESFPVKSPGIPPGNQPMNGGLSVVIFDPMSGRKGSATQTIFVGSVDPGDQHLFRSDDAGKTWKNIPGEPRPELLPCKAEIDDSGILYIAYSNGIGPNGVTDGAVMKLNARGSAWTDITPEKGPQRAKGGYFGISLDRQKPGTLAVSTMNRWNPGDTVWRSSDSGATWKDINNSARDVSATPFLLWGRFEAKLGWWMAALAIDPFDSNRVAYATGATIYATNEFTRVGDAQPTRWFPWVEGIEQTAIISLMSPTHGPHLFSAFGDISGFVHHDLDASPTTQFVNPLSGNTNTLDYAEKAPGIIVRSGTPKRDGLSLAWSEDDGATWQGMALPGNPENREKNPAIVTSADGSTFMVMLQPPMFTRDRGKTWTASTGLPKHLRPVPDRVNLNRFYAMDFENRDLYVSEDAGASFARQPSEGLPPDIRKDQPTWHESPWPLLATFGREGDLWFVGQAGLYHSADGGRHFVRCSEDLQVEILSLGCPAPDGDYPSLYAVGRKGDLRAIWRSDDKGRTWIRINDDQHQYGTRFRCLAADPRIFGRVYVGTDGRGIIYGQPKE